MDIDQKLIELVKDKKCLYDCKSRSRQTYLQREAAWKDIAFGLELPVGKCKQRWKSLRGRFIKEKKKLDRSSGSSSIGTECWELYRALKFLIPTVPKRRPSCYTTDSESYISLKKKDEKSSPTSDSSSGHEALPTSRPSSKSFVAEMKKSKVVFADPKTLHFDPTPPNTPPSSPTTMESFVTVIKESKHSFESKGDYLNQTGDYANKSTVEINKNYPTLAPKEENELFLEWIAKKMKPLSENSKLRIQEKLFAEVTKELRAD